MSLIKHKMHITAIAIGASLGGPQALQSILSSLPKEFPVPIYIVQHIAAGFTEGLAKWLQSTTSLCVTIACHQAKGQAGHVYIAPDHSAMSVTNENLIVVKKQEKQPSVADLFSSMAHSFGKKGVGVLLTGMGRDGAQELLMMKEKGAFTIAQDKEGCVMFGMPAEAIKLNAATKVLQLPLIPQTLMQLAGCPIKLPDQL